MKKVLNGQRPEVMTDSLNEFIPKARNPESQEMTGPNDDQPTTTYANVNLKLTEEEKWAFKEWCVHHRVTQVEAFRQAFKLLQAKHDGEPDQ